MKWAPASLSTRSAKNETNGNKRWTEKIAEQNKHKHWLNIKEKENECRQRFGRACTALTQSRSHMQSNKCQSKLDFTEDDEFTSASACVCVCYGPMPTKRQVSPKPIARLLTGSSFFFFVRCLSSFTFFFCSFDTRLRDCDLHSYLLLLMFVVFFFLLYRLDAITFDDTAVCCLLRKCRWFIFPLKIE